MVIWKAVEKATVVPVANCLEVICCAWLIGQKMIVPYGSDTDYREDQQMR